MRWQRRAFAALARWADLTQAGTFRDLAPLVIPTVSFGADFPDNERATFLLADIDIGPPPGEVGILEVIPGVGAVELLAAWCSRTGGSFNAGMQFFATAPVLAPTPIYTQSAPGFCNATLRRATIVPPWNTQFESPSDTTIQLPVRGTILELGFGFRFGNAIPGQNTSLGVMVRNVGGPG